MKPIFYPFFILILFVSPGFSQPLDNAVIKQRVEQYKNDTRGPYKDIRWFCKDGSYAMPKESCSEPGGVQRARYKDDVVALAKSNHVFLGQILSKTPNADFWDANHYHSRLKQYQLEKYLRAVDEGWVLRKAQFYRGAYQVEDETAWGIDFFYWLLAKDEVLQQQFFLLRQAAKDIPHQGDDSKTLNVRAVSKNLSESYPAFMDLRVKIHGQPEAADIEKVKAFRENHRAKLSPAQLTKFETLIEDMEQVYRSLDLSTLNRYVKNIPKGTPIQADLLTYIQAFDGVNDHPARARATADLLAAIREAIPTQKKAKARLALLDLSNALEEVFFVSVNEWKAATIAEIGEKICYTGLAAYGTGLVEPWEWAILEGNLTFPQQKEISLGELHLYLDRASSLIEWGSGMVNGVYKDVVQLVGGFEPLAGGFYDDRVRGSVLLPLGDAVGDLGDFIARESNLTNKVMNLSNQSSFRGLNPGFARGQLVVVGANDSEVEVDKNKIYVFHYPPSDLKPVAGILTVSEGNMVSHVQLLARNLAIPNAVLSGQSAEALKRFAGQQVFYSVSNRGTVIMKAARDMTKEEKELFAQKQRSDERITVPVEKIQLQQTSVLNLRDVDETSSGKLCGPKAANLGQLKNLFPDNVVEGLVLPFGVFRQHMDQPMPGHSGSYWDYLNQIFKTADSMRQNGQSEAAVESYTLQELTTLREAIKKMELLPAFVSDLETSFSSAFSKPIGEVPVFLRSDTNMEDLKDFTGAGLNLTLFNVVDRSKILQGIKDVWASPYTERSFKWRQSYLLNPENVYPSILIIPSVDVDYSGVLITKGLPTADKRDRTVAFSRGAGGAVDGQAAESYLLHHSGENRLLSPAREPSYRRLPVAGGSQMLNTAFDQPILNENNLIDLRRLANYVHRLIPAGSGPFDVELGFQNNKVWLFQIRPFVENKNALSSAYLESISPKIEADKMIALNRAL